MLLCVVIHTSSSSIQREKKLHLHHYQRESTHNKQKQTLNTTKRPPPPNKVSQTVYERAAEYSSKEKARERDASNTFSPHRRVLEEKNSTFFSRKKVTKRTRRDKCLFRIVLHAFRKVYHTYYTHTHALVNEHTQTQNKHEHRTAFFFIQHIEELRVHRGHGMRDFVAP